jgi:hypothetical protein
MWCGTCLTSKLYDEIIKRPSKFHETIPLYLCDILILGQSIVKICMRVTATMLKSGEFILYCKTSNLRIHNFSRSDFKNQNVLAYLSFGLNYTVV